MLVPNWTLQVDSTVALRKLAHAKYTDFSIVTNENFQ